MGTTAQQKWNEPRTHLHMLKRCKMWVVKYIFPRFFSRVAVVVVAYLGLIDRRIAPNAFELSKNGSDSEMIKGVELNWSVWFCYISLCARSIFFLSFWWEHSVQQDLYLFSFSFHFNSMHAVALLFDLVLNQKEKMIRRWCENWYYDSIEIRCHDFGFCQKGIPFGFSNFDLKSSNGGEEKSTNKLQWFSAFSRIFEK